ncbi:hypothetical protein ACH5RR_041412 [Cinchona calisaya]|uniref:PB1 domain-containing protein n=1 Tax=Cinchona calisaya TaxID=153742 RepID=A0ABD2XWS5_9GENT
MVATLLNHLKLYMEREVDYFDFIDPDMLTIDELKEIAGRIKYLEPIRLYYLVPGSNLEDGIIDIQDERDVKEMLNHLPKKRLLQLYLIASNDDSPSEREWTSSNEKEHVIGVGTSKQWKYTIEYFVKHDYDSSEKGSMYDSNYSSSYEDERSYEQTIDKKVKAMGWGSCNSVKNHVEIEDKGQDKQVVQDMDDPKFTIEMLFANKNEFRRAIRTHEIKEMRDVQFKKHDLMRVRAKCHPEGWKWVTVEPVQLPTQTQQEHQLGTLEGLFESQKDRIANLEVGTVRSFQPIVGIVGPNHQGVLHPLFTADIVPNLLNANNTSLFTRRRINIRYPPTRTKEAIKYMKSYWHCYSAPRATIPEHPLIYQEDSDSD